MKTYSQLLKNDDKSIERRKAQVKFLKENETLIFPNFYPQEYDYEVFVKCMEIFSEHGVNYFDKYTSLTGKYGRLDYANGLEGYCQSFYETYGAFPYDINHVKYEYIEGVTKIIKLMHFFEITTYNNMSIEDYYKILDTVDETARDFRMKREKQVQEAKECKDDLLIKEYYNFKDNDDVSMERKFEKYIALIKESPSKYKVIDGSVEFGINKSIEDDIKLNKEERFIVYFYLKGKVVAIGRTESLVSYIGARIKQIDFDSITYAKVKKSECEYLYVRSFVYFNISVPSNVITVKDRYFTTLNIAKKVYKIVYGINLKSIKKVISEQSIEIYDTYDVCVVNKKSLDDAIKKAYGRG